MALVWKNVPVPDVPGPVKQAGFSWDAWYAKNKARLSEKRARRYREDAAYREAALERSRAQREVKKVVNQGEHTVSFNDAVQSLGITVWVLREWRRKNYFPEPLRREGKLWFTPSQVNLLRELEQFFRTNGVRVTEAVREQVDEVVRLVYSNW